ncbi:SIR2 family protein [Acidithiobacillus sp. M4-SHS-6]|uniref:SIR2 family protein n=1 Tax=Acidithiobacillus sp. M4-SHS-6 TaxID=3383024 RepID=UPI0039BECEF4
MNNSTKEDLLVILGAGASIHAGMPGVVDITERLAMCDEWDSPWVDDVESVCSGYRKSQNLSLYFHQVRCYSRQYSNYEQFLGYLENIHLSGFRCAAHPYDVHTVTINTIIDTFRIEPKLSEHGEANYKELYKRYRLLLFTLNYDSVAEDYANRLGVTLSDGFSSSKEHVHPETFCSDSLASAIKSKEHILAHLHGSIFYSMPSKDTILKHSGLVPATNARFGLDNAPGEPKCCLISKDGRHLIASTIISGTDKSNLISNMPVMGEYMRELKNISQNVKRILIIGYGGNDSHVNEQLAVAYRNPNLRVAYITKSDLEYPPREVFAALPDVKFWTVHGTSGWKSGDSKVLVETSGFPLTNDVSMRLILNHLGVS